VCCILDLSITFE